MEKLNSVENKSNSNQNYVIKIYLFFAAIVIAFIIIMTMIFMIIILDYQYPEIDLKSKIISFYLIEILPGIFRLVLVPSFLFFLNIIVIRFFKNFYLLFLIVETIISLVFFPVINNYIIFKYSEPTLYAIIMLVIVFGLISYKYYDNFTSENYKNKDKIQTIVYEAILPRHNFFNSLNFIVNTLAVYIGSHTGPQKWYNFLALCVVSWSLAVIMIYYGYFRIELLLGVNLIAVAFRYESLYVNYNTNKAFKNNYDNNSKVWLTRLSQSNNIIKRYYCTQVIKVAVNKLGTAILVNPTRRTVMIMGGGFVFCGTLAVGAYVYKVRADTIIKVAEINATTRREEIASDERIRINKDNLDHQEKIKKIEQANKIKWPWSKK